MRRGPGRPVAAAVASLIALVLAGCGTASPKSPPTGVDELVIPSPSVDPSDFVDGIGGVDNPYFPLAAGAIWRYRVTGRTGEVVVTVPDRTEDVAGVATTVVEHTGVDGTTTTDLYAQDHRGNVWRFGSDGPAGSWRAGVDGAQAGLAMPAHPRAGDGWREAYLAGVVEDTATVVGLDEQVVVPAGGFSGLLEIATSSRLDPFVARDELYAPGVGLVQWVPTFGPAYVAALVSGP